MRAYIPTKMETNDLFNRWSVKRGYIMYQVLKLYLQAVKRLADINCTMTLNHRA